VLRMTGVMKMRLRHAARGRTDGLSLVELMVALAIIAALLVAAIPLLQGYQASRNLDLGAQQLTAALRAAADRARTEHYLTLVFFTTASGTYTVQTLSPTGGAVANRCAIPVAGTWSTVETDQLPSGLAVTSASFPSDELLFTCQGMPDDNTGTPYAADQTIVIANSAGSRTIAVRVSGEVACLVAANGSPCTY